jgi:L-ascorbate metabolism protein UlaG (beta-lactamase superfamily)
MRRKIGIAILGLIAGAEPAAAHDAAQARYLGNEGVMVSNGPTKILFDAFYAESFGGTYTLLPDPMEAALMAGAAPFDGLDAVFISHIHPDHFNSRKTIAFLRAHPNVRLYAGLDVIGAIYAADVAVDDPIRKQMVAVHVARGEKPGRFSIEGLEVEAFSIPHNGNGPIPHYAFRVALGESAAVIHLGDADAAEGHYAPYQADFDSKSTDVAFAPVWLLTSESGRRVLEQRIRAAATIGIHVESKHRQDPARARREVGADLFIEPGETRDIPKR